VSQTTDETGADGQTYTESEVRTISLAIISGVLFGGVATGVAFPTLPLLDRILGISSVMLGLILSANRISRLVMNTPAGNIIDRHGARRPMIAGLFVQALGPFGYILGLNTPTGMFTVPGLGAVSYPGVVFVLARGMWGVGSAFVFLGAFATITHVTTKNNRGRWLGYLRGGQSLGFPTGLVLGGLVTDFFSAGVAFLLAGVLALLASIAASLVLPEVKAETDQQARLRDIPAMIRRNPHIFPLGVGNMTIRFIFGGVLLSTVASYAAAQNMRVGGLSGGGISGLVLATGIFFSSGTMIAAGRLSDRLDNRAVVTVPAFIAMAIGLVVMSRFPTLEALVVGVGLVGIGSGGSGPALLAILGDITPGSEIGRMGSVYNVMGDLGLVLGPLIGVPMVEVWPGFRISYYLYAVGAVVTMVVVAIPLLRYEITTLVSKTT
jgi:MFS family permease